MFGSARFDASRRFVVTVDHWGTLVILLVTCVFDIDAVDPERDQCYATARN